MNASIDPRNTLSVARIEQIAQIVHEANRTYSATLGDLSHLPWDDTPEEIKASARCGVELHANNPGTTPEQSHESWLKTKEKDGWVYGEKKDFELKTHPCFRPYNELSQNQQVKDKLFKAIADTFIGCALSSMHG